MTVNQVLRNDLEWMHRARYPSPACFRQIEVELYVLDELPVDRRVHRKECEFCDALMRAIENDPAISEPILEEIRDSVPLAVALASRSKRSDFGSVDAGMSSWNRRTGSTWTNEVHPDQGRRAKPIKKWIFSTTKSRPD